MITNIMDKKEEKGNCPYCDESGWAGSQEMFERYRIWHEAGHPRLDNQK